MVNALSSSLNLKIFRDGHNYEINFNKGTAVEPLKNMGEVDNKQGTQITFKPDKDTFTNVDFSSKILSQRFREMAFLNPLISINFFDRREADIKENRFHYEGGIKEFVKFLDKSKKPLIDEPVFIEGNKNNIEFSCALWWNESYYEQILAFTNNIRQKDGGTHLSGFRSAITRGVNNFYEDSVSKKNQVSTSSDDIREGITSAVSYTHLTLPTIYSV